MPALKLTPVTLTGTGTSDPIKIDQSTQGYDITAGVYISGTATATLQYALQDVFQSTFTNSSGRWYNSGDLAGITASDATQFTIPISALRVVVSSGSGTTTLEVVQVR